MTRIVLFCTILLILSNVKFISAWDNDDLEIFDLVELVNQNFYTLMGINQDATLSDIKRAFRNLSIVLHPDKNSAQDANEVFRNLVSVYDVLKDTTKREKYDNVLKNGLPNWKSAVYYYRKARKMGLVEGSLLLFIITTICQYFVAWGVYLEKKYTMVSRYYLKL
jgi:DnaJ homolog subfamily C member 1